MKRLAWMLAVLWALHGCGGGGDEDSQQEAGTQPPSEQPPLQPPPEAPPEEPPPEEAPPHEDPPVVEITGKPWRLWAFMGHTSRGERVQLEGDEQFGGELLETWEFGRLSFALSGRDQIADGQVYSSESGVTYWVDTEAPTGNASLPGDRIGSETLLVQSQNYRKRAADATLRLVITQAQLEGIDFNGTVPLYQKCPWASGGDADAECFDDVYTGVYMEVDLAVKDAVGVFRHLRHYNGGVVMRGWGDSWEFGTYSLVKDDTPYETRAIFHDPQFELSELSSNSVPDVVGATVSLLQPVVLAVDLTQVPLDAEFAVEARISATAVNRRGRESYGSARLRDPAETSGTVIEAAGLEALDTPSAIEPLYVPLEFECSPESTAPAAGRVQFAAATFLDLESGRPGPQILVTRTEGSAGTVVVRFLTSDGSAIAGTHYEPVARHIVFHDGDDAPRAIRVPLIDDDIEGGERTVNLRLAVDEGCGTLGEQATAVLRILDDEATPPESTWSVGGTLSGLVGSGLTLEDAVTGSRQNPSIDGAFAFAYDYPRGTGYDVRVVAQPTNPAQVCTVVRGSGTVVGADVTDIEVTCAPPSTVSGLDPHFGEAGKVVAEFPSGRALALQADGGILVLAGMNLVRFDADGTLDASFGSGGSVPIVFNGALSDEAQDLAVQPDGRILVVGRTTGGSTRQDFAVNRYDPDGALDASFGAGGKLAIDFHGEVDRAYALALQPDGKILVGGHSGLRDPQDPSVLKSAFAVVRLNADGSLDTSFAGDGKAETLASGVGFAYALALQPDGKVLLGGRLGSDATAESDAALARFGIDGQADTDDDSDPQTWYGVLRDGTTIEDLFGYTEEVADLLVDADGRIWAAVRAQDPTSLQFRFALVEFGGSGQGFFHTFAAIGPGTDLSNALARQADGKFVLAGSASSATAVSDFGLVRFHADRSIDTSFGTDGVLTIDFFGGTDGANDVVVQPDGKIVAVGTVRNGSSNVLGLVRVLP